ncbi:MAG: MFS transporter, partial [Bdellovibrio sp.]
MNDQSKSGLKIIFLTVFLYLVGFGVIIPLLPILSREMGATAFQVGLLMSIYSLMQFFFAPFWGRLSDRHGRRPILLFCLLGEAASYLVFAFSRSVEMLIFARGMAGFFGASLSTATAAISDLTPPKERSKGMALIGMAFGLGFIVGPALGGGVSSLAQLYSTKKFFASTVTLLFVAGLCLLTWLLGLRILPETRQPGGRDQATKGRLELLFSALMRPTVGRLIFLFFLMSTAMSTMEATLSLFVNDRFGWGIREVSFGFAYIGVLGTFNQGFLVRKLLPKVGERWLMIFGISLMGLSLLMIGFAQSIWFLALAMTVFPFGHAFTSPSILGSVSLLTNSQEQGQVLGTTQGTAALGRILGPALGG